jgi:hypothetical protein
LRGLKNDALALISFHRTKESDSDSGTCYTDGKNAGFGCGVFVEGDDCEMTGDQMAA